MSVKNKFQHLENPNLPRLPVPMLEDSCKKYLNSVKSLSTPKDFEITKNYVKEFCEKIDQGPRLRDEVINLAKQSPTSFLEGFWDTSYLCYRVPFPTNINPVFGMGNDIKGRKMLQRASSIIVNAFEFFKKIRDNKLPQDKERTIPLCMSQYGKLFGSTRVPKLGRDVYLEYRESTHVIIVFNGYFYKLDLVDEQGKEYEEYDLLFFLRRIYEHGKDSKCNFPVGVFTALHRDTWSKIYPNLREGNSETLDIIESGLFCVVLEDIDLTDNSQFMFNSIVGNGCSRWFDKSLQFIVSKNGRVGLNMEHSGFDGHTILIMFHNMFNSELKKDIPMEIEKDYKPVLLEWNLNENLKQAVKNSIEEVNKMIGRFDCYSLNFKGYGKNYIKTNKISPDAYVQMAYQLAYFKMFGVAGSTYESANTKRFFHGRTECIRSVTKESTEFTKLFCDKNVSYKEKERALRIAANKHVQLTKDAKNGMGYARLFFAMKSLAKHNLQKLPNYQIPKIFGDKNYSKLITDLMSTSNCSGTDACCWFGFGPVAQNGFGLGYVIRNDEINVCITSFMKRGKEFEKCLFDSFQEMKFVIEKTRN